MAVHALCCGLPVVALALATGLGGLAGVTAFSALAHQAHAALHAHEAALLAASVALVAAGGVGELMARRGGAQRRFPVFFAVSAGCLLLNAAIFLDHHGGGHEHATGSHRGEIALAATDEGRETAGAQGGAHEGHAPHHLQ